MRVLIPGGAGYIGSICTEVLCDAGHTVTVVDNLSEGHRAAVDERAHFVEQDLADAVGVGCLLADLQAEAVIHFAANALVGESMENPGKYFTNNVTNAHILLQAARERGIRKFVFSSTCATYGVPESLPIHEDLPQRPINPYGESKLMFERMLDWYGRIYGIETVVFRYFNAAGATERFGEHHRLETHLVPNLLAVALGRKPHCEIYGTDYPTPDGTCIRDYIHVLDLVDAHVRALEPGAKGCYNLGNGSGYSVREVVQACERAAGRPIPTVAKPRRPGDPPRLIAAADKARRELGWQPRYPEIDAIVASAWKWHLTHPDGYPDPAR